MVVFVGDSRFINLTPPPLMSSYISCTVLPNFLPSVISNDLSYVMSDAMSNVLTMSQAFSFPKTFDLIENTWISNVIGYINDLDGFVPNFIHTFPAKLVLLRQSVLHVPTLAPTYSHLYICRYKEQNRTSIFTLVRCY